jgi:hypothetical protein
MACLEVADVYAQAGEKVDMLSNGGFGPNAELQFWRANE